MDSVISRVDALSVSLATTLTRVNASIAPAHLQAASSVATQMFVQCAHLSSSRLIQAVVSVDWAGILASRRMQTQALVSAKMGTT